MEALLDQLVERNELDQEELVCLLQQLKTGSRDRLFHLAVQTRKLHYSETVYLRGLIEFSSFCRQDCLYCGLRRSNTEAERYRLTEAEIMECAEEGYRLGYRSFVLQSGEDAYYTEARLIRIVTGIRRRCPGAAITLSVGERSEGFYRALFEAGADRYLLRHETASRPLYQSLHPGMSYDNRMECLRVLKSIGYQVGTGFMVGLPGQTLSHLAEDLLLLKKLQPHMIGIGPFIPHSRTPLGEMQGGTVDDTLVMLALARLLVPDALMPATTAMGTLDPLGREKALQAGCNVVMPILSPLRVRRKYALYENKICMGDEAALCRDCIEMRIAASGYRIELSRGDHCSYKERPRKYQS
ncbi:[FeFe] hydrogenase H-cluster radical SAM maturase HydE [Paenibacillus sp. FSL K6-1096]|uniref:[FeFe] hydrogenase H-cluster radical SAM maturase HydE n=1 Tax=Paenibacillus sp. FSL K6-1096 TaxID=2921460 RepID=UPI0030ECE26D